MAQPFEEAYGIKWRPEVPPLWREMLCIQHGGKFHLTNQKTWVGGGLYFHYKAAATLIWPDLVWHSWMELMLKEWLTHRYVGIFGPANSSKSFFSSWVHLLDYYCFPNCTTVIICSTTRESLENRIWGEMKMLHRKAVQAFEWIPGNLIEGKQRIVTDERMEAAEGRDFRNGLCAISLKKGNSYQGIDPLVGIKNKRLKMTCDELALCPKAFLDSASNLMKGEDRKLTGMGNPADTIDALGLLCEPAASLGGWDGGIDQTPITKTWETRWPNGICIQLCGLDSPNTKTPPGQPVPFPFLISPKDMEDDAKVWGIDDWHYSMFNLGRMPRGQGSRRVITRQMCLKFGAKDDPVWRNSDRTWIAFLDAAYRGVGGDRCVFGFLQFGEELPADAQPDGSVTVSALTSQAPPAANKRTILALIESMVIPISPDSPDSAEDQIVSFCVGQCKGRGVPMKNFYYDSGMRTSLVQAFGRLWGTETQSIDCGGRPTDQKVSSAIDVKACDYYDRKISQIWFNVRLIIESGQFRGMTEDVMVEGCAREWKTVGANKIAVETKKEMKEKTGRSPDLFDALAIGCFGAIERGFQIRKAQPPEDEDEPQDSGWKRRLMRQAAERRRSYELDYRA
jgi:hypothetical protein